MGGRYYYKLRSTSSDTLWWEVEASHSLHQNLTLLLNRAFSGRGTNIQYDAKIRPASFGLFTKQSTEQSDARGNTDFQYPP